MIYPSILNYIDALRCASRTLLSPSNRSLRLVEDGSGEPIYRVYRGYLQVNVEIDSELCSVALRTSNTADEIEGKLMVRELLVVVGDRAERFDIVICDAFGYSAQSEDSGVEICEDREPFSKGELWGFRDSDGEVIVEPKYGEALLFSEGRAVVISTEGLYGLIDSAGREIIEPIYDDISYDNSKYCIVERDGLVGVIDRLGCEVLPLKFLWVSDISEGLFLVRHSDGYSYYNPDGELAIDMVFDEATSFSRDGIAIVQSGDKRYSIDRDGHRVSAIEYIKI